MFFQVCVPIGLQPYNLYRYISLADYYFKPQKYKSQQFFGTHHVRVLIIFDFFAHASGFVCEILAFFGC